MSYGGVAPQFCDDAVVVGSGALQVVMNLFAGISCKSNLKFFNATLAVHACEDMTCELHDETAAGSQFVTHFTGRILERLSLRPTPINTKAGTERLWPVSSPPIRSQGFEGLLTLVENTTRDSFDLFFAPGPQRSSHTAQIFLAE